MHACVVLVPDCVARPLNAVIGEHRNNGEISQRDRGFRRCPRNGITYRGCDTDGFFFCEFVTRTGV